jgi:hypothetical protein
MADIHWRPPLFMPGDLVSCEGQPGAVSDVTTHYDVCVAYHLYTVRLEGRRHPLLAVEEDRLLPRVADEEPEELEWAMVGTLLETLQADPRRFVWRGDGGRHWFVTQGGGQFPNSAVQALLATEQIRPVYTTCPDGALWLHETRIPGETPWIVPRS